MKRLVMIIGVAAAIAMPVYAAPLNAQTSQGVTGETKMKQATGSFEVKIAPADSSAVGKEGGVGRMTIDKVLSGDLTGTTKGEMLTSITGSTGAMAYVAIETVTAALDGRSGTFVLMHNATMNKPAPESQSLHIAVVPASGTGGLTGISGNMTIHIDGAGKHTYTFDYELP